MIVTQIMTYNPFLLIIHIIRKINKNLFLSLSLLHRSINQSSKFGWIAQMTMDQYCSSRRLNPADRRGPVERSGGRRGEVGGQEMRRSGEEGGADLGLGDFF